MGNLLRLLLRFILVPLGYFAAAVAGTLVILIASWRLLEIANSGDPDGTAIAFLGLSIGGPILLIHVLFLMFLPASVGIVIAEAFAIRSWIYHVLNGVASAWVGWQIYGRIGSSYLPLDKPSHIIAAGIAGGFVYWGVAGFSAGILAACLQARQPRCRIRRRLGAVNSNTRRRCRHSAVFAGRGVKMLEISIGRTLCRLACVLALTVAVAGCDSCGDFVSPLGLHNGVLKVCRGKLPPSR